VAVLWNVDNPYSVLVFKLTQAAGRTMGIEVRSLEVRGPDDFDTAFEAARGLHPDALITVEDPLTLVHRAPIAEFTAREQLPSIHGTREFVAAGGLMSYGANLLDQFRRAASYVDKILRGAKPADLPVQQPSKFRDGHQPQDRQGARYHTAAATARPRRRGDRLMSASGPIPTKPSIRPNVPTADINCPYV
jgi:putative ABC transport system substrate-binding protein